MRDGRRASADGRRRRPGPADGRGGGRRRAVAAAASARAVARSVRGGGRRVDLDPPARRLRCARRSVAHGGHRTAACLRATRRSAAARAYAQARVSKTRLRHGGRWAGVGWGSGVLPRRTTMASSGWADGDHLALVAAGAEGATSGVELVDPPVGAVEAAVGLVDRADAAAVVDPALRQQALAVPHAVAEVQQAEPRPVLGGGVDERGADEGAGLIDARVGRAHADRVQDAARAGTPRTARRSDRPTDDARDDVRRARRVVEDGAGRVGERAGRRVGARRRPGPRRTASRSRSTRRRRRSPPPTAGRRASAAGGRA